MPAASAGSTSGAAARDMQSSSRPLPHHPPDHRLGRGRRHLAVARERDRLAPGYHGIERTLPHEQAEMGHEIHVAVPRDGWTLAAGDGQAVPARISDGEGL